MSLCSSWTFGLTNYLRGLNNIYIYICILCVSLISIIHVCELSVSLSPPMAGSYKWGKWLEEMCQQWWL